MPSESISYNRVYRHEHGSGNYIQIIVQYHPTRQGIYIARSNDARQWEIYEMPLLTPDAVEDATYVWSPCLVEWQGQHYLVNQLLLEKLSGECWTGLHQYVIDLSRGQLVQYRNEFIRVTVGFPLDNLRTGCH